MISIKDFLTLTKNRKTTYEFSDKKVKDGDINKTLDAARLAPILSDDKSKKYQRFSSGLCALL